MLNLNTIIEDFKKQSELNYIEEVEENQFSEISVILYMDKKYELLKQIFDCYRGYGIIIYNKRYKKISHITESCQTPLNSITIFLKDNE